MEKIRDQNVSDGLVSHDGVKTAVLMNRQLTRIEKGLSRFYEKGDVVEFSKDFKTIGSGVKSGDRFVVTDRDKDSGELKLKTLDGRTNQVTGKEIKWNPSKVAGKSKFGVEVYNLSGREFAKGDKIICTKTIKKQGIKNGMRGAIVASDKDAQTVTVKFGENDVRTLSLDQFKNLDHAYATTFHVAQGMTFDKAMFMMESKRKNLVNNRSFYVALSRAKRDAQVYTNDKSELRSALVNREGNKTTAHSLSKPIKISKADVKNQQKIGKSEDKDKVKTAAKSLLDKAKKSIQRDHQQREQQREQQHDMDHGM